PSLAELAPAWADVILPALDKRARAMYSTGHFVESEATTAVFALANVPTRDHCEKQRPAVEAALSAHFRRRVPLRLIAADGPAVTASAPEAAPAARLAEDDDVIDVHDLEDAPTAASGVERLSEAFPGAELVEEP
ncbi:MAG: hypothetical protein ACT452_12560, partial [Microthrixaceae bacterium]